MEVTGDLLTWETYGESVKTALGFFWKSGWAFVSRLFSERDDPVICSQTKTSTPA